MLHLQLHYTANGTAGTDRTRVGLIFAKQPPEQEMRVSQFLNAQFTIPAGASNYEVSTDVTFAQDATLDSSELQRDCGYSPLPLAEGLKRALAPSGDGLA